MQELSKVGTTSGSLARGGEVALYDGDSSAGCCVCKHGCWSRGKHSCVDCAATRQESSICLSNKGHNFTRQQCGSAFMHTEDCEWHDNVGEAPCRSLQSAEQRALSFPIAATIGYFGSGVLDSAGATFRIGVLMILFVQPVFAAPFLLPLCVHGVLSSVDCVCKCESSST